MITVDVGRNVHLSIDENTPLLSSAQQQSITSSTKNLKNPPALTGIRANSIIHAAKKELRELTAPSSTLPSVQQSMSKRKSLERVSIRALYKAGNNTNQVPSVNGDDSFL